MRVPLIDLNAQYEELKDRLSDAIAHVLEASAFAGGPFVEEFEAAFAEYCGTNHCIGVGSGTEALWLALLALDIGPGDEVVTVPNTFIATVEAISYTGARPAFVDVDPVTYTMDPSLLEEAISNRTAAIVPVHLYGQPASMAEITEIAGRYGIPVIEDAAQAHGAVYAGQRVGTHGVVGCYSFYPSKNLGAMGEAGAVVTNDATLAEKLRMLRDHGQRSKYAHDVKGWNARMDGLQGAVLSVKLPLLDVWNAKRQAVAQAYSEAFAELNWANVPVTAEDRNHVYHLYELAVDGREELIKELRTADIAAGIHYPQPIHLTNAYSSLGYGVGDFPVAENCSQTLLSLPMFPHMSEEQVSAVCEAVRSFRYQTV